MKITKRIAAFSIAIMCIWAFTPIVSAGELADVHAPAASKAKYMSFSTKPTMISIKVKRKKL